MILLLSQFALLHTHITIFKLNKKLMMETKNIMEQYLVILFEYIVKKV